jgi:hypothetical protein
MRRTNFCQQDVIDNAGLQFPDVPVSQSDHSQLRDCRICNTLCLARAGGYTVLDGFQTDRPDLAILDTAYRRYGHAAPAKDSRAYDESGPLFI